MWAAGRPREGSGGFTLLELLAALTIAGLVLAVSIPTSQRMYASMQYHGAVKSVVVILTSARYAAVRSGAAQDVFVKPDIGELTLNGKVRQVPSSVELEVVAARELNRNGVGVIRFFPDGSSSGGAVRLEHEAGMWVEVQVDWLLGRIDLCKDDCGGPLVQL
jgi:general secretion pathway protein H